MTLTSAMERRLRSATRELPVDYDASGHVVTAAATVLRHRPKSAGAARTMFALVHWGYGSAMAGGHTALVEAGVPRRWAAPGFFALCQTMALTLFPLLGDTPAPWRWRRDVLASSLTQHLVYVATVAAVDRAVAGPLAAA